VSPKSLSNKSSNVVWQKSVLTREERWQRLDCKGGTLWLTGLSASGKSTIASELVRALVERGRLAYRLDGDNLRHGLNRDLGFSPTDREENLRRFTEVSRLFAEAGILCLVSAITPYEQTRIRARQRVGEDRFVLVHVATPLAICEARDAKGLYERARAGQIADFTGISAPYEEPHDADVVLRPQDGDPTVMGRKVVDALIERGLLTG
jgi:bifunctional enzyme CysN/CysC